MYMWIKKAFDKTEEETKENPIGTCALQNIFVWVSGLCVFFTDPHAPKQLMWNM